MNPLLDSAHKITEAALRCETVEELQPAKIGEGSWRNELILFTKPEIFLVPGSDQSEKIVDLVLTKIREFDAHIEGITVIGGRVLEEMEIMNRHYGFINVLSRSASEVLNAGDKKKIEDALGMSINGFDILGGHEYLKQYPSETGSSLDNLWFADKSTKIRSGFYVRPVTKEGRNIILVNGFHPEQLSHFTNPTHKIVLMLLHSNTDWATLKNEMVGATFPEKAAPESIRGILYAHAQEYGFESVTIANNGVHLSAGPFEAMFEIVNFFGKITNLDLRTRPPLALRRMLEAGIDYEHAVRALDNPQVPRSGKSIDLFTATEDMNTDEAVALYKASL
ncbi:MAG TPA: hypothetical protein VJ761_08160 [Ktedonobacteraceae bacterium]|nr:hypothetical protein [Ktedonobacteraceae bacterium]